MKDGQIRTESNPTADQSIGGSCSQGWQIGGSSPTNRTHPIKPQVRQTNEGKIRPQFLILVVVAIGLVIFGQLRKDKGANHSFEVWVRETESEYAGYLERIGADIGEHEVSTRKRQAAEIVTRLTDSFRQHDFVELRREAINLTDLDGDGNSPAYRLGVEILDKYQIE